MSERDKSCHQDLANVPPSFREGKLTSTQVEEKNILYRHLFTAGTQG